MTTTAGTLPRITVVTPVLDQVRFVEAAMRSVLDQGYPDLEYFVIDGGSTDGSAEVVRRYADRLAGWRSERDAGQADAIEEGFERSTGAVMGWLNADDLLLPGALRRIGEAFRDASVDAVCGWSAVIGESGERLGAAVYPAPTREVLLRRPRLQQETVYWRRSVREKVGGLDRSLHLCFDRDLWLRMAQAGIVPRLLRRFLGAYRRHPAQKAARLRDEARREERLVLARVHGPGADPDALRRELPLGWRLRRSLYRKAAALGVLRPPTVAPTVAAH